MAKQSITKKVSKKKNTSSEKSKSIKKKPSKKSASASVSKEKKEKKTTSAKKISRPSLSKEKKKIKLQQADRDKELVQIIVEGMREKKARNITLMDLQKIENSFCNYFVICEADSKPQLQAITESVEEFTQKKASVKPHHIEGIQNAEWILLDYLTVVVHIFRSDIRAFYNIEELWADANIQHLSV